LLDLVKPLDKGIFLLPHPQAPFAQPSDMATAPALAFPEIPAEVSNGVANVFKSVLPSFLAQLVGR
jgi:hypothetical protein